MSSHLNIKQGPTGPYMPPNGPDLPGEYGMTRLVLLPRDPQWMHAAWEIAPYTWDEVKRNFGDDVQFKGHPVLRFRSEGDNNKNTFDVNVLLDARSWYVLAPTRGGAWRAELGLMLPDGRFVLLAISNPIQMPAGQVSDILDEKWGILKSEWERLFELSGGGNRGAGSMGVARKLAHRWELMKGFSSLSSFPGGASSWSRPPERHQKGFWLIADCEVIVYGATTPDAQVQFQGQKIQLNPDGTFSFRFGLPDGEQRFPIEATNKDGDLSKKVEFIVKRKTKK